jgi:2-polyprenyl-3-methyl-5-hydroxy-6-metoxy-1,4-benzoquinol methylase
VDYRQRVYQRYISTHFGTGGKFEFQSNYPFFEKYYRINYLKHLPADRKARVLDIGCGMGQFLYFLRANGYENHLGIDASEEVVDYCRSREFNVERAEAREHLAQHRETYDAIIMNDIVEHFTKQELFDLIQACHEALRPDGVLIIKTANGAHPFMGAHSLSVDLTHELLLSEESLSQLLHVFEFRAIQALPLQAYIHAHNPVHLICRVVAGCLSLFWRFMYRFYGRTETRVFTKSILAVGKK